MTSTVAADNGNPQAGAGRPLPKKEADMFKSVVKHYEMKQYKKAIKQADAILKKFPNHGETLAMKGLTLNYMSKRDEAHELVKLGLRYDMRSHVCWHVYGLLHRSDHNYIEAIKAYKQALRIDSENMQILRDLSMLQVQMRDLVGFAVTRNTLLTLKPNAKINWMAFALARHLTGDLRGAVKVIDTYMGTLTEGCSELGRCYESSELALYKNSILAEIPDNYKEALDHLNVCEGIVVDRGALLLKRAEYQLKLKDFSGVRQSVLQMFQRGMTENHTVHSIYMCAILHLEGAVCDEVLKLKGTQTLATWVPLSDEQKKRILDSYEQELEPFAARSHAIQRIPIGLLDENTFYEKIDVRCRQELSKGVPSLCKELQSHLWTLKQGRFYRTDDAVDIAQHPRYKKFVEMVSAYISNLERISKFGEQDTDEQPPSTLLWTRYLRAGLHEIVGEYTDGIALVDKCLELSPDIVDIYELKAKLLKDSGDIISAVECLDKGRELDKSDRYINNQTCKYMLQAGMDDEALKRISLFTKHEGNPEQNLFDMQCSWYELEFADSLARKEDWGRSLKKYCKYRSVDGNNSCLIYLSAYLTSTIASIVKHFDDFNEDQFDFHSYCLRKVTLRAYISVIRFEDEVYGQYYYCRAACGIIKIFLHLADNPHNDDDTEPDYSKMSAAERKKAKAIARKKKKVQEKREEAEIAQQKTDNGHSKSQKGGNSTTIEDDPLGKEYLNKDPLDEAKKFSGILVQYAPLSLDTWLLHYDVSIRRRKVLMAMRALFKAITIDPHSSMVFSRIVHFSKFINTMSELPEASQKVINEEAPKLIDNLCIADYIKQAVERIRSDPLLDLPFRSAVARELFNSNVGAASEAISLITEGGVHYRKGTVESCAEALTLLQSMGEEGLKAATDWLDLVRGRFPSFSNKLVEKS